MLTPDGTPANKIDKIMLLAMWANVLEKESKKKSSDNNENKRMILAGIGKPTYPINQHTVESYLKYWNKIDNIITTTNSYETKAAIDYGYPSGDIDAREIMARAMSKWYKANIDPQNILFTVGGAGALRIIFETFNEKYTKEAKYRIITTFPHYTLYANNKHILHPIEVMKTKGYKITANNIRVSIESAYELAKNDGGYPKAILLCNPNNPLGTIINNDELERIVSVFREYPDLYIIMDEAYAEMSFDTEKTSSILAIAYDLKDRIIILRSATKALSAAGERMAILMCFNNDLMGKLLEKNIDTIGHAPRSAQIAYAETMEKFTEESHKKLVNFYKEKVEYVENRLKKMGANMPDEEYKVEGTFYILGDFSDLFGIELPKNSERALEKSGKVETDEELAYYFLFADSIMLAPLSYFGLDKNKGFLRITCSANIEELTELMDRIEDRLYKARYNKKLTLLDKIEKQLFTFKDINIEKHDETAIKLSKITLKNKDCLSLKKENQMLQKIIVDNANYINKNNEICKSKLATTIQSFFRRHLAHTHTKQKANQLNKEWKLFVENTISGSPTIKNQILNIPNYERLSFVEWRKQLSEKNSNKNNKEIEVNKIYPHNKP